MEIMATTGLRQLICFFLHFQSGNANGLLQLNSFVFFCKFKSGNANEFAGKLANK